MRIFVFSDVHGNLAALQAVQADMAGRPAADLVVFAGDACLFGPRPQECVVAIREMADLSLVGNTDEWIFKPPPVPDEAPNRERLQYIDDFAAWTRDRLSSSSQTWLQQLPFAHRVSPTSRAEEDLLIVHANPQDTMQVVYPPEETQRARLGKLEQTDQDLADLLVDTVAGVIAYGHLHFPNLRTLGRTLLANISSVSLPGDGDSRAKYGILEWDGSHWQVSHVRVFYDVQAEIDVYRWLQPPDWKSAVRTLEALQESA